VGAVQKAENVGFEVRSLRQCFLNKQSLPRWQRRQKANIRGPFALYLLTVLGVWPPERLSLRPLLSKADDSAIFVRFL